MTPFEALTAEDKEMIEQYVKAYNGDYNVDGYLDCSLEHLLRFWDANKQNLFDVFNQHLIHEREICIQTPDSILYEEMEDIVWGNGGREERLKFIDEFYTWNQMVYDTISGHDYEIHEDCLSIISLESLVHNAYPFNDFVIPTPEGPGIKVAKGMKTMKIINKIVKHYPDSFTPEAVEEMRLRHSMILNQKLFKGTMCLSIHPLDFMTMSDNDCNWDSCMSWQKPGEYRLGTVEMMNSNCVVVAYLKATHDMTIPFQEKWNNKRWRELFIVHPDIITNIKGYPYRDNSLRDVAFDWLMELAGSHGWTYYDEEFIINKDDGIPNEVEGKKLYFYPQFRVMYNDYYSEHRACLGVNILQHSTHYEEHSCYDLAVSGETECMCCGADWSYDSDEMRTDALQCPNCSGEVKCPNCGDYVSEDSLVTLGDGSMMCRDCYEYYGQTCDYCEDPYHRDDIFVVYARHLDTTLDDRICICERCKESGVNNQIGPIEFLPRNGRRSLWGHSWQADTRNFTKEGFYLFDYFDEDIEVMQTEIEEYDKLKKS